MAHVPAPHVRDPRLDPQPGDTLTVGAGTDRVVYTVVEVTEDTVLRLCYVRGESGVEAGTTWSYASWSAWSADKPGHVWARRDPRTDPQPGDVNTGTAPEGHHAEVVTYTVVSRDDRALQVRTRTYAWVWETPAGV